MVYSKVKLMMMRLSWHNQDSLWTPWWWSGPGEELRRKIQLQLGMLKVKVEVNQMLIGMGISLAKSILLDRRWSNTVETTFFSRIIKSSKKKADALPKLEALALSSRCTMYIIFKGKISNDIFFDNFQTVWVLLHFLMMTVIFHPCQYFRVLFWGCQRRKLLSWQNAHANEFISHLHRSSGVPMPPA